MAPGAGRGRGSDGERRCCCWVTVWCADCRHPECSIIHSEHSSAAAEGGSSGTCHDIRDHRTGGDHRGSQGITGDHSKGEHRGSQGSGVARVTRSVGMSQRDGSRQFLGCSQDVFSPHGEEDFCTRDNWQVGSSSSSLS